MKDRLLCKAIALGCLLLICNIISIPPAQAATFQNSIKLRPSQGKYILHGYVCNNATNTSTNLALSVKTGSTTVTLPAIRTLTRSADLSKYPTAFAQCPTNTHKIHYYSRRVNAVPSPVKVMAGPTAHNTVTLVQLSDTKRVYGILYHVGHCPFSENAPKRVPPGGTTAQNIPIYNIKNIMNNNNAWGPLGWKHWKDKPYYGYYCLNSRPDVIKDHAIMLTEAGFDYIFVDITNWPIAYDRVNTTTLNPEFRDIIHNPIMKVLSTYKTMEAQGIVAPKIVPWAGLSNTYKGESIPANISTGRWLKNVFAPNFVNHTYNYKGKPLIFVKRGDDNYTPDKVNAALSANTLKATFEVKPMWAFLQKLYDKDPATWTTAMRTEQWSNMEACDENASGLPVTDCKQDYKSTNIPIVAAYQTGGMSLNGTFTSRRLGRTLFQQFMTVYNTEATEEQHVTVSGWNAWATPRLCPPNKYTAFDPVSNKNKQYAQQPYDFGPPSNPLPYDNPYATVGKVCAHGDLDASGTPFFMDLFNTERSRDLEPDPTAKDCYYELMKTLILTERENINGLPADRKTIFTGSTCGFNLAR